MPIRRERITRRKVRRSAARRPTILHRQWHRDPAALGPLAIFTLTAVVLFGRGIIQGPGTRYSGVGNDPEIFIWAFAWWPHAILHGHNPFISHAVWTP